MGTDTSDGPIHVYGNLGNLLSAAGQGQAASIIEQDPNPERGPSLFFMGDGIFDIRFFYGKDKINGYTGVVPSHLNSPSIRVVSQIPAAVGTNNLAAVQAAVTGVAMVLAGASTGIALAIPIVAFGGFGGLNGGAVVTPAIALDFGFAFGTVVAASKQITVADTTLFSVAMPLVLSACGNAAGTIPLLTSVASIDSATLLTLVDTPLATVTSAIGTGNIWGPGEIGTQTPTGALPYRAAGPGLFLDPAQAITRGLQISSGDGGALGGNFLVNGYDLFGMVMSELITVAAGASTGWGKKAFKYITSIVPQFTDPALYLAGTNDTFGFHMRSDLWEDTFNCYEGQSVGNSSGWTAGDQTTATTTTGDVRGTLQVSANGAGVGIMGGNASNGSIVSLAMSGRRLMMSQLPGVSNVLRGFVTDTRTMYGNTQA